jgi:hypothetical protein
MKFSKKNTSTIKPSLLVWVVFALLISGTAIAQETSKTKKLDIKADAKKTETLPKPLLKKKEEPPKKLIELDLNKRRNISMVPNNTLRHRGKDFEKKYNKKEGESEQLKALRGDQYLGGFKSNGEFVNIVCRDHEYVDGDRVQILVNDKVVHPNILLDGRYRGYKIDLEKGFNKIEFKALNEGESSPNTAELHVYNDKKQLISANQWLLRTGYKASIVVVKDGEDDE